MSNKMTYAQAIAIATSTIKAHYDGEDKELVLEKLANLDKQNSKQSKADKEKQDANAEALQKVLDYLASVPSAKARDIQANVEGMAELSGQKIAAIISPAVKNGKVSKGVNHGIVTYSLVIADEVEATED